MSYTPEQVAATLGSLSSVSQNTDPSVVRAALATAVPEMSEE